MILPTIPVYLSQALKYFLLKYTQSSLKPESEHETSTQHKSPTKSVIGDATIDDLLGKRTKSRKLYSLQEALEKNKAKEMARKYVGLREKTYQFVFPQL